MGAFLSTEAFQGQNIKYKNTRLADTLDESTGVSTGRSAVAQSAYMSQRYKEQLEGPYKDIARTLPIRQAKDALTPGPSAASQADFLRRKYATQLEAPTTFIDAGRKRVAATRIQGTTELLAADLDLLVEKIRAELNRLDSIRIPSLKKSQKMDGLDLLLNRVERVQDEVVKKKRTLSSIGIQPATAQAFIDTLPTTLDSIPLLFEEDTKPVAPYMPPTTASPAPTSAPAPSPTAAQRLLGAFADPLNARWNAEVDNTTKAGSELKKRIDEMEKRFFGYSYSQLPVPLDLQQQMLQQLSDLKKSV